MMSKVILFDEYQGVMFVREWDLSSLLQIINQLELLYSKLAHD